VLDQEVTLTSVDVRGAHRTLLNLAGERLAYWTRVMGNPASTTKLGPAQSAAVWLDVSLDPGGTVPAELVHAIGVTGAATAAAVSRHDDRDSRTRHRADPQACRHRATARRIELGGRQQLL